MSNYNLMQDAARQRFTQYDMAALAAKPGVEDADGCLTTCFFGETVRVEKTTGSITLNGRAADFCESLSIYDWLCDRKVDAVASGEFCPVSSLSSVYVSGSGLGISPSLLAERIEKAPEKFRMACAEIGAKPITMGDMGYILHIFPDLPMCMKFYFSDEDFPAQLVFLWDHNILRFVRYETVYYIAGCLQKRLNRLLD